jgi:hypothetical protein
MKRPVATIATLLIALYVVGCLRAFWSRPPLDFIDLPDEVDRQAVWKWYRAASQVPRQPWSVESFFHAISHPLAPHQFRPSVTEGGLGGEGSVMVSYYGFVGIFTRTGTSGALEFQRLDRLD